MQKVYIPKCLVDLLKAGRELVQSEEAGIHLTSGRRRIPGLRREEAAYLSHVSVTYYTWLEQGKDIQPSGDVLRKHRKESRLYEAAICLYRNQK